MTERAREAAPARSAPPRTIEVGRADSPLEREAERVAGTRRVAAPWRGGGPVPRIVHEALRTPGAPLDGRTRAGLEPVVGAGLSGVRVHDDATAAASARAIGAAAYTVGSHVVFGAGRYAPGAPAGRRLITHELAHVLQERDALLQRQPDPALVDAPVAAPSVGNAPAAAPSPGDEWAARLRAEFEAFGGEHLPQRYAAGRTWAIFTEVMLPDLRASAVTAAPAELDLDVADAVALARESAADEATAATLIDPEKYFQLFPETLGRWYREEADQLRASIAFDEEAPDDDWKVELAAKRDHDQFVFLSEAYEHERYEVRLVDEQAMDVSGGVFPEVPFTEHKRLLAEEGRRLAREAGEAEYAAYVAVAEDPKGAREAVEAKQSTKAVARESSSAGEALVAVEGFTAVLRVGLGGDVLPQELIAAWGKAEIELLTLNPVIRAGTMAPDAQGRAADAVEAFLEAFRAEVARYDAERRVQVGFGEVETITTNPYVSPEIGYFVPKLRAARTPADWAWPVGVYRVLVEDFDRYIAARLTAAGRAPEAAQLTAAGALTAEVAELVERKPGVKKVPAVFYPAAEKLENVGEPGTPDFSVTGFPLSWYLHREDGVWYLTDLSNPHQPKVVDDAGGTASGPAAALFEQLNTALRFPEGHLYWKLPDGTAGDLVTTAEWGWTEWLTAIGLAAAGAAIGIAAVSAAVVSLGGSVPASVLLLGSAFGVVGAGLSAAGAIADVVERSEAGVVTTQDVVVDTLTLAGSVAGIGSMVLGKVVVSDAVRVAGVARLAALSQQAFLPVVIGGAVADLASFAIMASGVPERLRAIDDMEGSAQERHLARARLLGLMLATGALTLLSVRGTRPSGPTLYIDRAPDGWIVRPFLDDPSLARAATGLDRPESITALLAREDLSPAFRGRMRAAISQALTTGPVEPIELQALLARMAAATTEVEVSGVLDELLERSIVGRPRITTPELTTSKRDFTDPVGQALWDDVPTDTSPPDFEIINSRVVVKADGSKSATLTVTHTPSGAQGDITREFNPRTGQLTMASAFLDALPSKVMNKVPLIPGVGTPLQTYLTIRLMKLMNVPYGGVQSIKISSVLNVEGILELHWRVNVEKSAKNLDEAALASDAFKYARTTAQQSGKEVVAMRVVNASPQTVKDVVKNGLMVNPEPHRSGIPREEWLAQVVVGFGLKETDVVQANFDIFMDLIDHPRR